MNDVLLLISSLSAILPMPDKAQKPNIVVLVADDLGYGELGCQGNPQIPTPNIDAIASSGVRFTSGYVTAPVSSPSRAALISGMYQSRFGYDNNPLSSMNEDPRFGLPETIMTFGNVMQSSGYRTALIGKWHLGGAAKYNPVRRGFDEFYGFLHEGHFYVPPPYDGVTSLFRRQVLPFGEGKQPEGKIMYKKSGMNEDPYDADNPILRGGTPIVEPEYLTDALAREAVDFIDRNKQWPFFLYLPFNAVHSPLQGADKYMEKMKHIDDIQRRIFAAMLVNLDDAVGRVMKKIREEGLEENTLIFFLSDNGGPTAELTSSNKPLKGGKGSLYEGGIRVPFMVQWKGIIPAGRIYDYPVISIDILVTAAALGKPEIEIPAGTLEGINLIPYITGEKKEAPHDKLFWRFGNQQAMRLDNWKLYRSGKGDFELYDLSKDISEANNLAAKNPEKVTEMIKLWDEWNSRNVESLFPAPKRGLGGSFISPI